MITQLRDRTRADRFLNDVRANQKKRRNYGRYVYLTAVAGVFAYLLSLFVGPYLWLRAEGLVVSDYVAIASPYDVQVVKMLVRPGQRVKKGDILAQVQSPQVTEAMATLTSRAAETYARQAELTIRLEVANAVIQQAGDRLLQAENQLKRVNASRASTGFVSDAFIASVVKERYSAMQEKVSRDAERKSSSRQLLRLEQAQAEAKQALEELRITYNDGNLVAPEDGVVGPKITVQGDVVKSGDHLMELYVGPKYALVYLETGTLYEVQVGDRVEVADGFNNTEGTIREVLPLTVPLPSEFQKSFRPPTRGQVAKIVLDEEATFPLSSKIAVTGDTLIPGALELTRSMLYRKLSNLVHPTNG